MSQSILSNQTSKANPTENAIKRRIGLALLSGFLAMISLKFPF